MPAISFLMAAFKRPRLAMAALQSLQRQTMRDWELIVSPDDGSDYRELAQADARVRVVRSSAVGTGPARARNRALALACGALITVLDDDDCLEPAFAAQAVHHFKSGGAKFATASTKYVQGVTGSLVRHIGQFATMDIDRFGRQFGTMHAIGRREAYPRWTPGFAEDVMHTCRCIDLDGGKVAVLQNACYLLRLHADSLCAQADGRFISQSYAALAIKLPYQMTDAGAKQTQQLLHRRIRMNDAFTDRGGGAGYHEFVQDVQRSSIREVQ